MAPKRKALRQSTWFADRDVANEALAISQVQKKPVDILQEAGKNEKKDPRQTGKPREAKKEPAAPSEKK